MCKRGMIDEANRAKAQEKWDKMIVLVDEEAKWYRGGFETKDGRLGVSDLCGYCFEADTRRTDEFGSNCNLCYISKSICPVALYEFRRAMDNDNRPKARAIAVRIRDYIKNDKPKEV